MDIIEPTVERQYGGGLDDAYMNRRRSSAFADPNATSAFASPMSMGGLPTIYRDVGGGLFGGGMDDDITAQDYANMAAEEEAAAYGFDEFDQADADAGAAGRATKIGEEPDYISYDSRGRAIQAGSPADEALNQLNIRNAAVLGGERYRDRFDDLKKIDPDSKLSNLQLIQRGIDRGLYNKAGIPLANFLEDKGLATFGKGMRGPFESSTPGGALYRYADDKRSEEIEDSEKRGVYGEVGFEDSSPESKEFEMRMRYAKPGETVQDIAKQMFDETKMVAPTQNYGYSSNSKAQATQVWDALNDARGAGMIQGLGLLAMGASSPQTLMSTIGSQYDNGETRSILGQIGKTIGDQTGLTSLVGDSKIADRFKTAIDLAERGPGIFTIEPLSRRSVASDPRDMTDVVNPAVNQDLINSYRRGRESITKNLDDKLEKANANRRIGTKIYSREDILRDAIRKANQYDAAYAQIINKPSKELGQMEYQSERITPANRTRLTLDEIEERNNRAREDRNKKEPVVQTIDNSKKSVKEVSKQEPSFFDTVLNFFKSSGSPVTPNQDDLGASNDAVERRRVAQPTQKEVAAIAQEAAKIPEEVQKTITSAGLLPQYLALIRAGYTAERAIKAIGLPAGTAIA